MDDREIIDQYDLVEVIRVPEAYRDIIEIGDIGSVVEKYDNENFEVECIKPEDADRWLGTLNIRYIRLRSKDPYQLWVAKSLTEKPSMQRSVMLGAVIGTIFGALIGGGLGAITGSLGGILMGLLAGLLLGFVTGALTAALTVKVAGRTGGIGVGYFTGLIFGGVFGVIVGALIPTSLRIRAHTEGLPVLEAFAAGRFETAILTGFTLSTLATIVGAWISARNQDSRI